MPIAGPFRAIAEIHRESHPPPGCIPFAGAVLTSLSEALQAVGQVVEAIAPAFDVLGKTMGSVFNLWENTGVFNILEDAFEDLAKPLGTLINALVSGLAPILPPLIGLVGSLAGTLIKVW